MRRFVDTEKWRVDTKLDETVPIWDYPEKEELFKFYPQYYHKTDKVREHARQRSTLALPLSSSLPNYNLTPRRTVGQSTSSKWAALT